MGLNVFVRCCYGGGPMSFQQEQSSSSTSRTSAPEGGACRKAPTQEAIPAF